MKVKQMNRKRNRRTEAQMKREKKPKTCLTPGFQLPDDALAHKRGQVSMWPDGIWRPVEPIEGDADQ